ncbi:hypothetical protein [Paenibacillus apiarius]|uniref:hypothetical protein n=1 Tax=Paenibacillus apiarius TaxID=46240 RepID=UPI003B3B6C9B
MRAFNAELSKLFSLPGIWLAFLIGAFAPAVFAALDSIAEKEEIIAGVSTRLSEVGYGGLDFGVQGVIILAVLMINSSVVTVSVLLSRVTKLAFYLPDRAGIDMFMSMSDRFDKFHTPFTGGLIMFAWVAVLFIVAAIVFHRRDVAS